VEQNRQYLVLNNQLAMTTHNQPQTRASVFDSFANQIASHNAKIQSKDLDMIKKRIENPDISDWFKDIVFDKPVDIIELGCSVGHLPVSELLFGNLKINFWTGYDCDKVAINIANSMAVEYNLTNQCKFIHSAVSSHKTATVYSSSSYLLGDRIYNLQKEDFQQITPNVYYKDLPYCDILLVDIEGEEFNIDFKQMQYKYCLIETNTASATSKFVQEYVLKTDNMYKVLQNCKTNDIKNCFLIMKKQMNT